MLIYRPMLGLAMFTVPLHLYPSLYINIVHGLDQFRSHMIMMDVDMCLVCCAIARARKIAVRLVGRPPFESGLHLD